MSEDQGSARDLRSGASGSSAGSYSVEQIVAALDWLTRPKGPEAGCACIGAHGDEPFCGCMMRRVIQWNGQWFELQPAKSRQQWEAEAAAAATEADRQRRLDPARLP